MKFAFSNTVTRLLCPLIEIVENPQRGRAALSPTGSGSGLGEYYCKLLSLEGYKLNLLLN